MMSIKKIPVTIGITAFNCEETLGKAIESARKQLHESIKILIVDDCSTDETHTIAKSFAKKFKNITVVKTKKNGGVAVARNIIIKRSSTPFICFFDDDDISAPNRINEQLKKILTCEENDDKKLVICHTARTVEYAPNNHRYEGSLGQEAGTKGVSGKAVSEAILCGTSKKDLRGSCPTCTQMARTRTYKVLGGFDERLRRSDDTDFCIRAAEHQGVLIGIKEPLVHQVITAGTDKSLNLEKKTWEFLFEKHRHIIERKMRYSVAIQWLNLRHSFLSKNHILFLFILFKLLFTSPKQTLTKILFALPNFGLHIADSKYHRWGANPHNVGTIIMDEGFLTKRDKENIDS